MRLVSAWVSAQHSRRATKHSPATTVRTSANYGNYRYSDGSIMAGCRPSTTASTTPATPTRATPTAWTCSPQRVRGWPPPTQQGMRCTGRSTMLAASSPAFSSTSTGSNNSGTASRSERQSALHPTARTTTPSAPGWQPRQHGGCFCRRQNLGGERFPGHALPPRRPGIAGLATGRRPRQTPGAWYDAAGTTNFLKDATTTPWGHNDATVVYQSDGYSNCGKTGSATISPRPPTTAGIRGSRTSTAICGRFLAWHHVYLAPRPSPGPPRQTRGADGDGPRRPAPGPSR